MNINNYKLWTALITPFLDNQNQDIDFNNLKKLLIQQNEAKNGILILGSTGEALNLTLTEKKSILEFVCSLKLKVPIMVGIGGSLLNQTIEFVNYCNNLQIDAFLLSTPLYAKPGIHGQTNWFKTIMDKAQKACVLYNIPSRAGISLHFKTVANLLDHKNFWGIKEASGSIKDFKTFCKIAATKKIFSGDDILMPEFSKLGAFGLISVASNIWPTETYKYCQKALNNSLSWGDITLWKEACSSLFLASNPVPAKVLLYNKKEILSDILRPPLSSLDLSQENLEKLLQSDLKITEW